MRRQMGFGIRYRRVEYGMKAILFDAARCIGCRSCEDACADHNKERIRLWSKDKSGGFRKPPDGLSSDKWIHITFHPLPLPAGVSRKEFDWSDAQELADEGQYMYTRHACMHCVDPGCVSACISGALQKNERGSVTYDSNKCIGCRYCMVACPFGIPKCEWHESLPCIRKCTMCDDLVSVGKKPACVEACPGNNDGPALLFNERDSIILEAKKRIENSGGLYNPAVFGEKEVGGTCVLYISRLTSGEMGFISGMSERSIPDYSKFSLSTVPYLAGGLGLFLGGLYWFFKRRDEVQKAERLEKGNPGRMKDGQ